MLAFAGCFGGEDSPSASNDPTSGTPPTGNPSNTPPGGNSSNSTGGGSVTPPPPAGSPVNDTQTLAIQGPGPTGGGTPIHSTTYTVSPGFTSFTVALTWFETTNAQDVAGLGSVMVQIMDAEGNAVGSSVTLQGPAADPAKGTLTVDSVPVKGDYHLSITPQDPAARGNLMYTIQVAY